MFVLGERVLKLEKNLVVALRVVKGIGFCRGFYICSKLGYGLSMKVKYLNLFMFGLIFFFVREFYIVEGSLLRRVQLCLRKRMLIGSYRYFKYLGGLPVRGQRTHSNSKTSRRLCRVDLILS
jgi:small subunit ribosomal protein S13